jgi:hypothetical protein
MAIRGNNTVRSYITDKRKVQVQWPPNSAGLVAVLCGDCRNLILKNLQSEASSLRSLLKTILTWHLATIGWSPYLSAGPSKFSICSSLISRESTW